ncbi:hypothetical protein [Bradyrhizobium sp. Leo170]|uniref:hypothetical protein n=1 Tax=Bradyrhizobium sp. Leo170 TaxID=1571199 RepID=UPI00102EA879|nr:hypothetical protein [Bradyrhizobium sp. Leo170]TAI65695.1 hypothetical protein CWO89_12195 [Bradyrhizobium sp. Leo170]
MARCSRDEARRREQVNERQRACRARKKADLKRFTIDGDEAGIAEAMINSTRLTEAETADHDKVETALAAVVAEWAKRWR